ncbi:MAG: DUF4124 domain-containing protein [Pseudomonadota bacterium]
MRTKVLPICVCLLLPLSAFAQQGKVYKWEDEDGNVHYGDAVPADAAEYRKEVKNSRGITVDEIRGRKTAEEIEAEKRAEELAMQKELQLRADRALLATYQNVEEIEMHRDRRIELFQAQSRVTELYLRNLDRRLGQLRQESGRFRPYSSDPSAPMIEPALIQEIKDTEETIDRHRQNLEKYQEEERKIMERFDGDIHRFRDLKGIPLTTAQATPE